MKYRRRPSPSGRSAAFHALTVLEPHAQEAKPWNLLNRIALDSRRGTLPVHTVRSRSLRAVSRRVDNSSACWGADTPRAILDGACSRIRPHIPSVGRLSISGLRRNRSPHVVTGINTVGVEAARDIALTCRTSTCQAIAGRAGSRRAHSARAGACRVTIVGLRCRTKVRSTHHRAKSGNTDSEQGFCEGLHLPSPLQDLFQISFERKRQKAPPVPDPGSPVKSGDVRSE